MLRYGEWLWFGEVVDNPEVSVALAMLGAGLIGLAALTFGLGLGAGILG